MDIEEWINGARRLMASDIHLTVGDITMIRINGELVKYGERDDVGVNRLIHSFLTAEQERQFSTEGKDLDFSFETSDGSVQRVNVFHQNGRAAAAIRLLNTSVPSLEDLEMPPILSELAAKRKGLVLVTGATGSGKTTTLAAMIDEINKRRACHIVTIEDPIEYRYERRKAIIHQRELGRDVSSFRAALKSVLREDPDVILIGEMRDFETISLALTAAETGHLVFATLHTASAAQTIDRIIDECPVDVRDQVRGQVANLIQGIIAQTLVPRSDEKGGRTAAMEILVGNDAVKNMIRNNKIAQLPAVMQTSAAQGMCTLNDYLTKLCKNSIISYDTLLQYSADSVELTEG
ncbi:MAG: PilT/PilU family type 4a pilus ATPase [Lachnospiraceae bacterium]|nr:PilT/PilU family type 4a pilus ATPase [Lachnospiraceae bacterium]